MKTYLYTLLITLFLHTLPLHAADATFTVPTMPEHPSIAGFHTPQVAPAKIGGIRNVSVNNKLQLDSIVYTGSEKITYTYNDVELNSGITFYKMNGTSWIPTMTVELTYNNAEQVIGTAYYNWNAYSQDWVGAWKTLYTYNNRGDVLTEQYITYDTSLNKWVNSRKYAYSYTSVGLITKRTYADWNSITSTWEIDWITDYIYTIDAQKIAEVSYAAGYVARSRTEYTYNELGVLIQKLELYSSENRWEISTKEDVLLDNMQRPVVKTYARWNNFDQVWENSSKSNVEFDDNGIPLSIINYQWNTEENTWNLSEKQESVFDNYGTLVSLSYFKWNAAANNWIPTNKYNWNYNNNVSSTTLVVPYFKGYYIDYSRQVLSITTQEMNNSQWNTTSTRTYYYSVPNINTQVIEDVEKKAVSIYPNPTSDYVVIELPTTNKTAFYLYDNKGVLVDSNSDIHTDETISLSHLPTGSYFYQVVSEGEKHTGTIIKK